MIHPEITDSLCKIADTIQTAIDNKTNVVRIYGSSGSAKTYSILLLILDYLLDNPNSKALILSYNLQQSKLATQKDLKTIMQTYEIPYSADSYMKEIKFDNGSMIYVSNPSDSGFGKGLRGFDIIYADELDRFKQETIEQVMQRSSLFICSFNPVSSWVKNIPNTVDCRVTYKDNKFISEKEKYYLEQYEVLRHNDDGSINQYYDSLYQVFTCGEWSINILQAITNVKFEEQFENFQPQVYGLDFSNASEGKGDPDAMIAIQVIGRDIYIKSCFKTNELSIDGLVTAVKQNNQRNLPICCDSANGRTISYLKQNRINAIPANKTKTVLEQVRLLNTYKLHVLKSDTKLRKEIENYQYETNEALTLRGEDHLIDALRYGLQLICREFIGRITTTIV